MTKIRAKMMNGRLIKILDFDLTSRDIPPRFLIYNRRKLPLEHVNRVDGGFRAQQSPQ